MQSQPTFKRRDSRFGFKMKSAREVYHHKLKRASKPKTRTGCGTCRARRVKCDENRPTCLKCAKLGHECEGYRDIEALKRRPPKPQPVIHRILPKIPRGNEKPSFFIGSFPTCSYGMNERDGSYFQLYQKEIASELAGGFESSLWSRIVLQASENSSIRYLIIAITAVKQNDRTNRGRLDEAQDHRLYALQKYSQALKRIQGQLSRSQESIRFALIAALLIFVFEALLGDIKVASRHVQRAMDLLDYRLGCSNRLGTKTNFIAPPPIAPAFVESEVLRCLRRLDRPGIKLLGGNKGPQPAQTRAFSSTVYLQIYEIPETFVSLEEARHYFELIHFKAFPESNLKQKMNASTHPPEEAASPAILLSWLISEMPESVAAILRDEIARWHRAFAPLLRQSRTESGTSTFIPAMTLSIQTASIGISLCGVGRTSSDVQSIMVEALHAARGLLTGARDLISWPKYTKSFVFDVGIIPSLWIVIVFCSDISYKKEALGILRDMQPRVECVWDSRVVAQAGKAFIEEVEKNIGIGTGINIATTRKGNIETTLGPGTVEQFPLPTMRK